MDALKSALYVSLKRPAATIFMSLIIFVYCVLETNLFHVMMIVLMKFVSKGNTDILATLISLIQVSLSSSNYLKQVGIYTLVIILISVLISFVFSGYFYIINNIIEKKKKYFGEFFTGVKKYYKKFLKTTILAMFISSIVVVFLIISTVPAIISTNAMSESGFNIFIIAIILDIVSVFMLFFGLMFLRIYVMFWYPSIYYTKKGSFKIAKTSVDKYFWDVVEKFIAFDVVFVLFQVVYLLVYSKVNGNNLLEWGAIGANWIFKSLFFIAFVTYIFRSFKFYRDNDDAKSLKKSYNQTDNFKTQSFNNNNNYFNNPNPNNNYQDYYNNSRGNKGNYNANQNGYYNQKRNNNNYRD